MKKVCLALLFGLILHSGIAQNDPFDKLGAWHIISSNSKFSEKWSVQAQVQFRLFEVTSQLQQFKFRAGATYAIVDGLSVGAGYAYLRNDISFMSDTPPRFDEHRIVEDIYLNQKLGKAKINLRARVENRFLVIDGNTDVRHWFRYLTFISYPLTQKIAVDLYNEIFLNLEEPIFSQDWFGSGVSYKINDILKARIGYQRIFLTGPDFNRVLVELNFNFDFSKKNDPQ